VPTSILVLTALATGSPLEEPLSLARATIRACEAKGRPVSASVVDAAGVPIVVPRADARARGPARAHSLYTIKP
jgi:uncharacterized protein GlcG (DUF336 family)